MKPTALEEGGRIARVWLVGVAWRLRRPCACPRCHRLLIELLADSARLTVTSQQEARPS